MNGDRDSQNRESDSGNAPPQPPPPVIDAGQHHQLSAHKGYETAKRLAKRLRQTTAKLSVAEWLATLFTAVIAAATVWNVIVIKAQQKVMQGQLDEMQAEQRSWVSVAGNPSVIEPLSSDVNGLRATLGFVLKNTGKNPAVNAVINVEMSISRVPDVAWQKAVCAHPVGNVGESVFSGDQVPYSGVAYVGTTELAQGLAKRVAVPFVVACVVYRDATTGKQHHTPYAYQMNMNKTSVKPDRGCCAIVLSDLPIDGKDLLMPQWPLNVMPPD